MEKLFYYSIPSAIDTNLQLNLPQKTEWIGFGVAIIAWTTINARTAIKCAKVTVTKQKSVRISTEPSESDL